MLSGLVSKILTGLGVWYKMQVTGSSRDFSAVLFIQKPIKVSLAEPIQVFLQKSFTFLSFGRFLQLRARERKGKIFPDWNFHNAQPDYSTIV